MSKEPRPLFDVEKLTQRERGIMQFIVAGLSTIEIAKRLDLSPKTVETHRGHIHKKLGTRTSLDILRRGLLAGVLTLRDLVIY